MPNKNKNRRAKNQTERTEYGRVSRKQNRLDPTGEYGSLHLHGSDNSGMVGEPYDEDYPKTARPGPKTWFARNKEKLIEYFIFGLIIAFIGFTAKWMFDRNADIEVIEYRIVQLQERIDSLDDGLVTKEVLDLRLELVKNDLSGLIPDLSGITEQIEDVENRLTEIENGSVLDDEKDE